MIVVADASVLVGESLRKRGRELFLHPELHAAILTGDHDFLGCGCPTWTVETLRRELEPDDT
jgi:PIN domain